MIPQLIYFVDILLFTWLTLIMVTRVLCKIFILKEYKFSFLRLKVLLIRKGYWSDILFLIASIIGVCKFVNQSISKNYTLYNNIFWIIFINLVCIALLIRYKKSQPKLLLHLYEDIKTTIHDTYNLFKK